MTNLPWTTIVNLVDIRDELIIIINIIIIIIVIIN